MSKIGSLIGHNADRIAKIDSLMSVAGEAGLLSIEAGPKAILAIKDAPPLARVGRTARRTVQHVVRQGAGELPFVAIESDPP